MKTLYRCEVCHDDYDTDVGAMGCENTHNIITPSWWWSIPFVGFIYMTYKVFAVKKGIVIFNSSFLGELLKFSIYLGPCVVILITMWLIS